MYYPYLVCHCGACRKTAGLCDTFLPLDAKTMKVEGIEHAKAYRAKLSLLENQANPSPDGLSHSRKHFCEFCGSNLWGSNPK